MSVNNRVVRKVEAEKWEIEETFEIKLDKIKPDHMKTIDSFDIEISAITFKKTSLSPACFQLV